METKAILEDSRAALSSSNPKVHINQREVAIQFTAHRLDHPRERKREMVSSDDGGCSWQELIVVFIQWQIFVEELLLWL